MNAQGRQCYALDLDEPIQVGNYLGAIRGFVASAFDCPFCCGPLPRAVAIRPSRVVRVLGPLQQDRRQPVIVEDVPAELEVYGCQTCHVGFTYPRIEATR